MVYKGDLAREREIVRSLVEHYHDLGEMRNFISILHPQTIKEVLAEMNLESLRGFDLDPPVRAKNLVSVVQFLNMSLSSRRTAHRAKYGA